MAVKRTTESTPMKLIRDVAAGFPETQAEAVCVKAAFRAGNKSFLFLGMDDANYNVMIKLTDSIDKVQRLEEKSPDNYNVGMHGWVKLVFPHSKKPPKALLTTWIEESYRNLVPKRLVSLLDEDGSTGKKPATTKGTKKSKAKKATQKKSTAKKKAAKKKSAKKIKR